MKQPVLYRFATNLVPGRDGPGQDFREQSFVLASEWFALRDQIEAMQRTDISVMTTEEGECVCVARVDEEGRILKVIWEKKP